MRVRMKSHITGSRNGEEWPPKGGVLDVPELEAEDLFIAGLAEPAGPDDPEYDGDADAARAADIAERDAEAAKAAAEQAAAETEPAAEHPEGSVPEHRDAGPSSKAVAGPSEKADAEPDATAVASPPETASKQSRRDKSR